MIGFFKRLWRKLFPKKVVEVVVVESFARIRRKRLKKRQRMCAEMGKRNGKLY